MTRDTLSGNWLLLTAVTMIIGLAATLSASAQVVVESRTETITRINPTGMSTMLRDDAVAPVPAASSAATVQTSVQEVELITLAFQIPDFDPADLDNHVYHVGMVSESGGGGGNAYPDDIGYLEFELSRGPGEAPMKTFLFSLHVDTGAVEVFIHLNDLSLNMAVRLMSSLQNSAASVSRHSGSDDELIARMARHFNPATRAMG